MICIPLIALFRQFTNMQKKLCAREQYGVMDMIYRPSQLMLNERQGKGIEYIYCIEDYMFPEKFVSKLEELDFLQPSLLKMC